VLLVMVYLVLPTAALPKTLLLLLLLAPLL